MQFTRDELALIRASCLTACPQYPGVPMWEPWASIYGKAGGMMMAIAAAETDASKRIED